jgi:regulator of sigma E protease
MSILYFVILIGVLIFVHELGHFLVAKWFDVKVQRFSIGFGPKIVGFTRGETEYVICALPLGGYVQMLGFALDEIEEIPEEERDRALMMKPIWQRTLITLAGPGANVILPIIIYFIATMGMTEVPPAKVGEVFAETPAAEAGLLPGDQIEAIDGQEITYWHELQDIISDSYDREVELKVERDGELMTFNVTPEKKTRTDFLGLNKQTYGMLGIHLTANGTTVAVESPDTPAAKGGLETFDDVITVDGEPVTRYDEITSKVRQSAGESLDVRMLRRQPIDADYGRFYAQEAGMATVTPVQRDGDWTIGIDRAEM